MRTIMLRPEVDPTEFEVFMHKEVFPVVQMLLRDVSATTHTLFKREQQPGGQPLYVWITVNRRVGKASAFATPEIPKDLPDDVVKKIEQYGTIATLTEVSPNESA